MESAWQSAPQIQRLSSLTFALATKCTRGLNRAVALVTLVTLGALPFWVTFSVSAASTAPPQPPTLNPPAITAAVPSYKSGPVVVSPYSHGEPTAEEQYMLELINQARANPVAEGLRLQGTTDPAVLSAYSYFGVDTGKLVTDFAGYQARPPLAFNAHLIAAARGHSQDMAVNDFQGHVGSNGSSFSTRVNASGYIGWNALAENVFAYAQSLFFGHAGFNADWGVPSLGHRMNIMNFSPAGPVYTEIGIGIVGESSPSTGVGPLIITEDFGRRSGQLFVVGVVYVDTNGDGLYSVGEGAGGVTVTTSQGNYAYTSVSGGYAIPLTSSIGTITVRAEGASLAAPQEYAVSLAGTNAKVDFIAAASASVTATSTGLTSNANPAIQGQGVTLMATVTGASPTGTITFRVGATTLAGCAAVPLTTGQAQCIASTLLAGSHDITASYSGDSSNAASTSALLVQSVLGRGHILFQHTDGRTYGWTLGEAGLLAATPLTNFGNGFRVKGMGGFAGDGTGGLYLRDGTGANRAVAIGRTGDTMVLTGSVDFAPAGLNWDIAAIADFDGDGKRDVFWREVSGYNFMYSQLNQGSGALVQNAVAGLGVDWKVGGVADFDGDGKADIFWRNVGGANGIWYMTGPAVKQVVNVAGLGNDWALAGIADFNNDGKPDLLWRNINGANGIWLMNANAIQSQVTVPGVSIDWRIVGTGDYNGDGYADILWEQTVTGTRAIWFLRNGGYQSEQVLPGTGDIGWQVINPKSNR